MGMPSSYRASKFVTLIRNLKDSLDSSIGSSCLPMQEVNQHKLKITNSMRVAYKPPFSFYP